MKKQIFTLLLAFTTSFAFCNPENDFEFDFIQSKKNGDSITITKYIGKSPVCEIPQKISGVPVKRISNYNKDTHSYEPLCPPDRITQLLIPEGVESIGPFAFSDQVIKVVTIPPSVTSIGERAFAKSGIRTLNVSPRTKKLEVGQGGFENNHLTELKLPSNVDYIFDNGENTFGYFQATAPVFSGNDFVTFIIEPNWYGKDNSSYSGAINYEDTRGKLQSVVYKSGCKSLSFIDSPTLKSITIPKSIGVDGSGKPLKKYRRGEFYAENMTSEGIKYESGAKFIMVCKLKSVSSADKLKFQKNGIAYSEFPNTFRPYGRPKKVPEGIFSGGGNSSGGKKVAPKMTADEIRRLPSN